MNSTSLHNILWYEVVYRYLLITMLTGQLFLIKVYLHCIKIDNMAPHVNIQCRCNIELTTKTKFEKNTSYVFLHSATVTMLLVHKSEI